MTDDGDGVGKCFEREVTRRQLLQGVAVVGAAAAFAPALAACGGSESTESPSPTSGPKKGGSLVSAVIGGSAKDTLDVHMSPTEPEVANSFQLYNQLFEYTPDYKLTPGLAEEATPNADATVWTVRLKPEVFFSDGRPVTADDVIFSISRIIDPESPKNGAQTLGPLRPDGMRKLDERTVEFTFDQPYSIFPEGLGYRENGIVPVDYDPQNPIGTGPFKLQSFTAGQQTVFVPNEYFAGEGPYVDELTIVQLSDPTARANALISGEVHHATQMAGVQAEIAQQAGLMLWETKAGSWVPFTMRIDVKPFSDVRVRQAMRLIPDREQMIAQAVSGYAWVGNDMYAPFDLGYPSDLPQRQQDLEQAKSLLKQAGQEGLKTEIVTSTAVGSGGVEIANVFAEQAKGAGVDVKVKKVDPGAFYGEDYLTYAFATDGWGTRNYLLQTTLGTLPDAPYNETHWSNDKWLAVVEEAFRTIDETKRNELVAEASTIEYEEGGLIIWGFNTLVDGYSDKLDGLVHDVFINSAIGSRYHLVYFK